MFPKASEPVCMAGHMACSPTSLLLILTLKFYTSVARLSKLSSKCKQFALEVYINAISKLVITFLYM